MAERLVALLNGVVPGQVEQDRHGRLAFVYDDTWRSNPEAGPLSLSMPLAVGRHGHEPMDAFLWGLLPDKEQTLRQWGQRFQVSLPWSHPSRFFGHEIVHALARPLRVTDREPDPRFREVAG
jgi:HipA-like protein